MVTAALLARAQDAVDAELRRFVGDDPNRSVAVHLLDGPLLRSGVAADVVRPAASFLKVLPAVALYGAAERGEVDLDAAVPRGTLGETTYPTILAAFRPERLLSAREVCAFSLITSDNPAAEYILGMIGFDRVRGICRDLRLIETALIVGFKDEELGASGRRNVSTAGEALRIIEHVETAPGLAELRHFLVNNQRNNRIPVRLEDDIPVMHKTGSLEAVVNDIGVVYHPGGRIALAYLCDHQPDTALTAVQIGDSALRVVEIVADLVG